MTNESENPLFIERPAEDYELPNLFEMIKTLKNSLPEGAISEDVNNQIENIKQVMEEVYKYALAIKVATWNGDAVIEGGDCNTEFVELDI